MGNIQVIGHDRPNPNVVFGEHAVVNICSKFSVAKKHLFKISYKENIFIKVKY